MLETTGRQSKTKKPTEQKLKQTKLRYNVKKKTPFKKLAPAKHVIHQLYRIPIVIGNTITTRALLDTGATASILSAEFLSKIPESELKHESLTKEKFKNACGTPIETMGAYDIDIRIHTNDTNTIRQTFHILPNLTEPCILGLDFITNHNIKLDSMTRRITYTNNETRYHVIGKLEGTNSTPPPTSITKLPRNKLIIEEPLYEKYRNDLEELITSNHDITAERTSELGKATGIKHAINTGNEPPVHTPPYRSARSQQYVLQQNIDEMLRYNIIRPSSSPYSSPVVLIPKKTGEKRLCIDYRLLNQSTVKDKYPLPRIDVVVDYLHGAKYFSTLDLCSGYWQIEIEEKDKIKTAFTTEDGHYEFNRMPFGLANAPATFQRFLDNVLRPVKTKFAMVYLDDVIVYSKTIKDHLNHLRSVFDLLRKAGLKIKPSKCIFLQTEVEYLGHIFTKEGIKPDPKKQKAVKEYPAPKNVDQTRSFLGLAGYYRKFIKNFAGKAQPLTVLTKKDTEWIWGREQEEAFQLLKDCLIKPPILRYPDFTRDFIIDTDASGFGVGSVLGQVQIVQGEEKEVVIAYASKHLSKSQVNWSTEEKECFAILHATKVFYPYLYGRRFQVRSDNRALQWLKTRKNPTGRIARWALRLQEFDMDIQYRPGKAHQNADSLSRIPNESGTTGEEEDTEETVIFLTFQEFKTEQLQDEYCGTARKILLKAQDRRTNEQMVSDNEGTTQDRRSLHSEAAASPEDTSPSPLPNDVPY